MAPRDIAALAAAIDHVLTDSAERGRFIAAGRRQVAEYFSSDSFVGNMIAAYES